MSSSNSAISAMSMVISTMSLLTWSAPYHHTKIEKVTCNSTIGLNITTWQSNYFSLNCCIQMLSQCLFWMNFCSNYSHTGHESEWYLNGCNAAVQIFSEVMNSPAFCTPLWICVFNQNICSVDSYTWVNCPDEDIYSYITQTRSQL